MGFSRLEIGGVTPQFVLLERIAVVQAHDQRGINLIEESREAIVHEHRRKLRLWKSRKDDRK